MPITKHNNWTPPALPESCGASELADVILDFRPFRRHEGGRISHLSDRSVRRVIELAYLASMLREEGQYVRASVYAAAHGDQQEFSGTTVRFGQPIPLDDPNTIRKLAPAAHLSRHPLLVEERDGSLFCTGIVMMTRGWESSSPGSPFWNSTTTGVGLSLIIHGPGSLEIDEGMPFELHAGRIRSSMKLLQVPILSRTIGRMLAHLFGSRMTEMPNIPFEVAPKEVIEFWFASLWEELLQKAKAIGRGGAFIIADPCDHFDIRYAINDLDLGKRIVEFWDACFIERRTNPISPQKYARWRDAYVSLWSALDLIAQCSAVDGCVALDRSFRVLGFGGKLRQHDNRHDEKRTVGWSGSPDPGLRARVRQLGTRHSSAFQFCCDHPGALAIVVSQDGDIRVFLSNQEIVCMVDTSAVGQFGIPPIAGSIYSVGNEVGRVQIRT